MEPKKARELMNLSQQQMADFLRTSIRNYQAWERKGTMPLLAVDKVKLHLLYKSGPIALFLEHFEGMVVEIIEKHYGERIALFEEFIAEQRSEGFEKDLERLEGSDGAADRETG